MKQRFGIVLRLVDMRTGSAAGSGAVIVAAVALAASLGGGDSAVTPIARDRVRPPFRLVDVADAAGVEGPATRTWGASWADWDRDGDPDLFIGRHWRRPLVMVNEGGTFKRRRGIRAVDTTKVDRHSCTWGEANGDGAPDLYCARGADKGMGSGDNQLFLQTGAGFRDAARSWGVDDPLGRGRSANWLDYDTDGDLDLFVANSVRTGSPNLMFANADGHLVAMPAGVEESLDAGASSWSDWDRDGDPDLLVMQHDGLPPAAYVNEAARFGRTELPGVTTQGWRSAAWGDFDGDGWTDLHLVSATTSAIFRNEGGRFVAGPRFDLTEGRTSVWFDVDNDSDLDLYVVQGAEGFETRPIPGEPNHGDLLMINERGSFRTIDAGIDGTAAGNGDAVAAADFDRDGRLDLVVTNGHEHWTGPTLLLANRSVAGRAAGLLLDAGPDNPFGFGARVRVAAGHLRYEREVTDGFAYRAQSEAGYVHLGLGSNGRARVQVMWPDGSRDCAVVAAGTVSRLVQGSGRCR